MYVLELLPVSPDYCLEQELALVLSQGLFVVYEFVVHVALVCDPTHSLVVVCVIWYLPAYIVARNLLVQAGS